MSLPPPAERGQSILADEYNQLAAAIRARTISHGGTGLVQQRGNGTVVLRRPTGLQPAPRRSTATGFHPFQVIDATTETEAKVYVRFGQVNNITPTIGVDPLNNTTPPTLVVVTGVVYLNVTIDEDGIPESAVVENAATVPDDTATNAYKVLATVTVASDEVTAIDQSVTHSLGLQQCGDALFNWWGV